MRVMIDFVVTQDSEGNVCDCGFPSSRLPVSRNEVPGALEWSSSVNDSFICYLLNIQNYYYYSIFNDVPRQLLLMRKLEE
jgi:hypothetical protein